MYPSRNEETWIPRHNIGAAQRRTQCNQQRREIPPLSAPSNRSLFRGSTAIAVRTPLNVSDRNLVDENNAVASTEV